jgi:hypothetical protein
MQKAERETPAYHDCKGATMIISKKVGRNILIWGVAAIMIISLMVSIYFSGDIPWRVRFTILSAAVSVFASYVFIDLHHCFIEKRLKADAAIHIAQLVATFFFSLLVCTSL